MKKCKNKKNVIRFTEKEKEILYCLFMGDALYPIIKPSSRFSREYLVSDHGAVNIDKISYSDVLSLVTKGAIQSRGGTVKEWKMQVALGVNEHLGISFILTKLGESIAFYCLSSAERMDWQRNHPRYYAKY